MFKTLIVGMLCLFALRIEASDLRKIIKAYEKADWSKTESNIQKALDKNPVNPGAKYFYSRLYLEPGFSRTSLDSARQWIRAALLDWTYAEAATLGELADEGIQKEDLIAQLDRVAALWYDQALADSTVASMKVFIELFPEAAILEEAIKERDARAYALASREVNESSLRQFLSDYPYSHLAPKVQTRLDSLVLASHRESVSVSSLEKFIYENPTSAYVEEALMELLQLQTLTADPEAFLSFIRKFSDYSTAQMAIDWLFHIDKEKGFALSASYLDFHRKSDSLRQVIRRSGEHFIPAFDGTYSFISPNHRIHTPLVQLDEQVLCHGLSGDTFSGQTSTGPVVLSGSGTKVSDGTLIEDLGMGLLLVQQGPKRSIIHKTGREILANVEAAEIIGGKFLKVKRDLWGLYSLMGIEITDTSFDEIFKNGEFWFFRRNGLLATATLAEIASAYPNGLFLEFKFDDYELVAPDLLVGFREDRECLMKSNGEFAVAWGRHHIYPQPTQGYLRDERGYAIYGGFRYDYFPYLEVNNGFIVQKEKEGKWMLISQKENWVMPLADSVKLINEHCALVVGAQPRLIFQSKTEEALSHDELPRLFSPLLPYVMVQGESVTKVYDKEGRKVLAGNYEEVRLLADSLFAVTFRGRQGLIAASGRQLLSVEYEYIGVENGMISTLRKGKIGGLDPANGTVISPQYDGKPERVGALYKVAKEGMEGLIDRQQKVIVDFQYESIRPWSDSLVWLQSGQSHLLFNLYTRETTLEVGLLAPLEPSELGLFKFYGPSGFGVLTKQGILIPSGFSDIRFMGSSTSGYIVAEQHLIEAGYYVLTYYSENGAKVFSQAYRAQDYGKVLCDD